MPKKRKQSSPEVSNDSAESLAKETPKDKIIIFSLIGILLIFAGIVMSDSDSANEIQKAIKHLLRDAGIAFLTAAIIAYLIEIPNLLSFFKERIIAALKDYEYLKDLDDNELKNIKKTCNDLLFLHGGKRLEKPLNESLLQLENEFFDLIMSPYYEYLKTTIVCTDFVEQAGTLFPGDKCVKKIIQTNFKLVNPLQHKAHLTVLSPVNLYCPGEFGTCESLVRVTKLTIKVDKEPVQDLTNQVKIHVEELSMQKFPNYNRRLIFKFGDKDALLSFNSEITVEIEQERFIAYEDRIYTRRVDKPTKNLSVNYMYDNPNFKLKADCFGTLTPQDPSILKTEHGNALFIECLEWIMPGNGIIIVTLPTERTV